MSDRILPQLDAFEKTRWSHEVELQRNSNAATQFLAEHPQYFNSDNNSAAMLGWLTFQRVPVTLKNLTVAFRVLSADGKLESFPVQMDSGPEPVETTRGINKMDVKDTTILRYRAIDTPLNRQLVDRDYAARQALCRIGVDPKKTALGAMHRQSLRDEHESRDNEAYLAARQRVILENPKIPRDSERFSRLVQEILSA
jgi:hypothetical protein